MPPKKPPCFLATTQARPIQTPPRSFVNQSVGESASESSLRSVLHCVIQSFIHSFIHSVIIQSSVYPHGFIRSAIHSFTTNNFSRGQSAIQAHYIKQFRSIYVTFCMPMRSGARGPAPPPSDTFSTWKPLPPHVYCY